LLNRVFSHRGYSAVLYWEPERARYFGRVADIQDVVTFYGETREDAEREFRESVDDYIQFCEELGKAPEVPAGG
jgi:predicted HicB family RNase H-like nuclease